MCDLDEALGVHAAGRGYAPDDVYKKKMALIQAYNKSMNARGDLFSALDDNDDASSQAR
ncbi:MAG: hypothetical protein LBS31_12650 [Candidatus Adiutrix sp.]|nr:hypothetical protein [Candidatus Adiutrix sp.]